MINCEKFYKLLISEGIDFFTGVPDSLLKDICGYINDHSNSKNHIISSNEGSAVGLAIGYNLATGKVPLVYLQNSGLGNIINPLLSLADRKVYSIPIVFMIGWRGEPGVKDEPQHIKQGEKTLELLEVMEIKYIILKKNTKNLQLIIKKIIDEARETSSPTAIVVSKNTFTNYSLINKQKFNFEMNRELALKIILSKINPNSIVISTTGKTSREVFEYREKNKMSHDTDFLTVGGMGHCNQIALGIAIHIKKNKIYCIDGDGAAIMHFGSLGIIGDLSPKNLIHIIINNGSHDSVGGQPTIGYSINFSKISKELGYKHSFNVDTVSELKKVIHRSKKMIGPIMIHVLTNKGARNDLGRPNKSPLENKMNFLKFLNKQ